jgi:hypothetical protein
MSRFNSIPAIVQQIGESILDSTTPSHVKFNQAQVLETIKDYCETVLTKHNKTRR